MVIVEFMYNVPLQSSNFPSRYLFFFIFGYLGVNDTLDLYHIHSLNFFQDKNGRKGMSFRQAKSIDL